MLLSVPGPVASQITEPNRAARESRSFVVRSGDVLRIRVWPDVSMSGEFPVEESGMVHLPVIGAVRADGIRLADLREQLRDAYGQSMRSPVVSVMPLFRVSVLGGVNRPGLYSVDPTMSIFDVVSEAGGFAPGAKDDQITVVRDSEVLTVDLRSAVSVGTYLVEVDLRSGDRIIVPQKARFSLLALVSILQAATLILAITGR
jgi:polysaccharide export outer membrane protein